MMRTISVFARATQGLVTIEWVAISAVALVAAVGISAMLLQGADDLGGSIADRMSAAADEEEPAPEPTP